MSKVRAYTAVVLAAVGAVAVAIPILVLWSGQPVGDPYESDVLEYYSAHAADVRLGDVLWIGGVAALVASAALILPAFSKATGTTYLGSLALCGVFLVASAAVAFELAGEVASGGTAAGHALDHWQLEVSLFDAGTFLLAVPLVAAAAGIDRERRHGLLMTVLGIVAALLMISPLSPWNLFAVLAWIVAMTAFVGRAEPRAAAAGGRSLEPVPAAA
jgi:hypothetical protein